MRYLIVFMPLIFLGSLACTASNTQSAKDTATSQAEYCSNLSTLKTDLLVLQNLGPSSSVGQVRASVDKVQEDVNDLARSAKQLQSAKVDQISSSYQNLQKSAQSLPDSTSIVAAVATLTPQLAAINNAQTLELSANCK